MSKLSKITDKFILFLLAAALLGCGKEARRTDYVAKVNNSYLTEQDIEKIMASAPGKNFYRNEIIRNWINSELLYQKAVKEGIIRQKEYNTIIEDSRRELAGSMLLEQLYNGQEVTVKDDEINEYYNNHREELRLSEKNYLLKKTFFTEEDYAIKFRNSAMENSWRQAVKNIQEKDADERDKSLLVPVSEIHPAALLRVIDELYPGEISIVVNDAPGEYVVVQMLQKYEEGTIPPLEIIKQSVTRRIIQLKKEEFIKNYIKELYSDSEIDVKQE